MICPESQIDYHNNDNTVDVISGMNIEVAESHSVSLLLSQETG